MKSVENPMGLHYDAAAMRGRLITFEGGEGSGKSTHLALLADDLEARGYAVVRTREPGGTPFADRIRTLILAESKSIHNIDPKAELFLMLASRAQHVREVILPALSAGRTVLCDRFTDASIAYQGAGRGLPKTMILEMSRFASKGIMPDLTFLLDIPIKEGLSRVAHRGESNRLDEETLGFHEAVQRGYAELAAENPKRIARIDAALSKEAVAASIRKVFDAFFS